jgi:hypothetical protein
MCSIITVKTSPAELSRTFGRFDDPDGLDTQGVEIRVHGFLKKELAPVLWNDWFNPLTGEFIPTFTLLTDEPDSTVFAHGHDRSIIPIGHSDWMSWLQDAMDASSRVHFLRSHRIQPEWTVAVERDLKLGWQKRAPSPDEIAQIKVWHPV